MPKKKRSKRTERPVFDSLRKPTAPPSRRFEEHQLDEKHYPAGRNTKHKKPVQDSEGE